VGQNDQKWPGARRSSAALRRGLQEFSSPKVFKVPFINKVFQQNSKGEYVLAPGNAQFEGFKKNSEISTNTSQVTGLPYSIMLWKKSRGNGQNVNDAERRGDVYQKDGYYHVKTVATAIEKKQESIHVEQALEPIWHWSQW